MRLPLLQLVLRPILAVAALAAGHPLPAADESIREARGRRGVVVSVSPEASDIGIEIMKAGGNAVDAAVATALALAVTHPPAGNIGGGGFMLVLPPGGEPVCIDYRETAPAAATVEMFAKDADRHDHKMVGVPGTLRGLALAHEKFGKLKWKQLVEPAIKLAAEGVPLDEPMAASLNEILAGSPKFEELQRVYAKADGEPWKAGDRLIQKDLAATLQIIADDGPESFYTGKVAEMLVAEMKAGGGLITLDDLKNYKAIARKPIHTTYRGFDIYGPPPPSSGGIALGEMLNVLETFPLKDHPRESPETLHLLIETMKRAFCDRARHLGDGDFVEIPSHLITKDHARKLAEQIDPKQATPSEKLADDIPLASEGDSTTHFSVIDADGLAVSNTYTLEESYGSRIVVRGAGFLLNNEMGDFNWRPGHTDRLGAIGTPPNVIAPGKRMLSSMTPTIIAKDGRPVLVVGSPGGRTIINTVLCVVVNVIDYEMDLKAAVDAPRLHHQWFPDVTRLEQLQGQPSDETLQALKALGHDLVVDLEPQGDVNAIRVHEAQGGAREFQGVADRRRFLGKAAAW